MVTSLSLPVSANLIYKISVMRFLTEGLSEWTFRETSDMLYSTSRQRRERNLLVNSSSIMYDSSSSQRLRSANLPSSWDSVFPQCTTPLPLGMISGVMKYLLPVLLITWRTGLQLLTIQCERQRISISSHLSWPPTVHKTPLLNRIKFPTPPSRIIYQISWRFHWRFHSYNHFELGLRRMSFLTELWGVRVTFLE